MRKTVSLNGLWQKSRAGETERAQIVPYSALPCGETNLRRAFDCPEGRAILRFEGITYQGWAYVNGMLLGEMPPYCRCEFDITEYVKRADNELVVKLVDLAAPFGPSEGWENYGGIIRGAYLDVVQDARIADVFFLPEGARVRVRAEHAEGLTLEARLYEADGAICARASGTVADGECALALPVLKPRLWSPDDPYLYTLRVSVGGDETETKVGFKFFACEGRHFTLNGERIFLRGVCRHDLWGDDGHTLSDAQIERDMRLIKATGANFVRLVHYPHDTRALDWADKLGLLVSEEPGLWWSDMHNEKLVAGALEVMRRTVLRDRSRACVAFWLAFNECVFTKEYLLAAAKVCRDNDPTRLVSGANCMDLDMTRDLFAECGFDFYTFHPYGMSEQSVTYGHSIEHVMDALCDKPLLFTEWGGYPVCDNGPYFTRLLRLFARADRAERLAGFSYWVWADMYEFQRGEPACFDGRLFEGLVDMYRNPRENYALFQRTLADWPGETEPLCEVWTADIEKPEGACHTLELPRGAQAEYEALLRESEPMPGYYHKKKRNLRFGPSLEKPVGSLGGLPVNIPEGMPLIVRNDAEINAGVNARSVYLLLGTLPGGWPISGTRGEASARVTFVYADGEEERTLENGAHTACAIASIGPSRIEPIVPNAQLALKFTRERNWEHYAAQLVKLETAPTRRIEKIRLRAQNGYKLAVFAITCVE